LIHHWMPRHANHMIQKNELMRTLDFIDTWWYIIYEMN
jgi:hypothetical protein